MKHLKSAELEFYNYLRDKIPGHVQRIENSAGAGMPDVNICCEGIEIWVELKIWLPGTGVLLRKEQYAWGHRRAAVGGRVFIVALDEDSEEVNIWKFPSVSGLPYGTQEKYVLVNHQPAHIMRRRDTRQSLKTILFA